MLGSSISKPQLQIGLKQSLKIMFEFVFTQMTHVSAQPPNKYNAFIIVTIKNIT